MITPRTERGCKQLRTHESVNAMAIHESNYDLLQDYNELGKMAVKIASHNFDIDFTTLLFFNSTILWGIEVFLQLYNHKVLLSGGVFNQKVVNIVNQYVVFGIELTDIEEALDLMLKHEVDNTGKFIIVCQSNKRMECEETDAIELFSARNIVNVIFIKIENARATGYTYLPISNNNCNNLEPVKLNRSLCSNEEHANCSDVYYKLKDLHLCPLVVSTFLQAPYMNITHGKPKGADGDLVRVIADTLNAKLVLVMPHRGEGWGWRQDNGTWVGSLADLYEGLANISMTSAALTLARVSDFQISNSYFITSVAWVTHPAKLQPVEFKLLYPFKTASQIALLISFILVVLCAFLLRTELMISVCRRIHVTQPTKSVVFYSWMICMGQSISKFPSKAAILQVTLLWILYCFLIRTAYQVYLISCLKGKFFEDQFECIEEAIKAEYLFGGGPALKEYFIDYPHVYDNWINIEASDMLPTFINISKGMKFVLAINLDTAKFYLEEYKICVYILPQRVVLSPTSLFFKRNSPLAESINAILRRLSAAGLPQKFHEMYTTVRHTHVNDEEEIINLNHLTACYVVLLGGWIVSFVFFLLEIYFGKIYKHPAKSQYK